MRELPALEVFPSRIPCSCQRLIGWFLCAQSASDSPGLASVPRRSIYHGHPAGPGPESPAQLQTNNNNNNDNNNSYNNNNNIIKITTMTNLISVTVNIDILVTSQ